MPAGKTIRSAREVEAWLAVSNGNVRETYISLTPETAKALLKYNTGNRRISRRKVEEYTAVMRRGEWMYNGDPIRVGMNTGRLLDAQHRLQAVINSGVTLNAKLVAVAEEAQMTMDQGLKRTHATFLYMDGVPSAASVSAAARLLWVYEQTGSMNKHSYRMSPTAIQLDQVLDENPELIQSVVRMTHGLRGIMPESLAGVLHYLFSTRVSQYKADEFFDKLRTGAGIDVGNPILALRNRLQRDYRALDIIDKAALTIRAFNSWRAGRTTNRLVWSRDSEFPRIS